MNTAQNDFYTSISAYYNEIFPYNPVQLKFVENNLEELPGKKILDIGCATGELALQLAEAGAQVTAIDLNEDLLDRAKAKNRYSNLNFRVGNMLQLQDDFQPGEFDAAVCFGNTLVHLQSEQLVAEMLQGVYAVLKPGGVVMLQILNYNYILSEKVTSLPVIESENIRFVRNYEMEEGNPLIRFITELYLKKEGKVIRNTTRLLALQSKVLIDLLGKSGFVEASLYSSFSQGKSGGNHLPLVVKALSRK